MNRGVWLFSFLLFCVNTAFPSAEIRHGVAEWGADPEEIIALFRGSLSGESLILRFAAASALEEFGRHLAETVPVFIESLQNSMPHHKN